MVKVASQVPKLASDFRRRDVYNDFMVELKRFDDPVLLQVLCDALQEKGIAYRVDNAGMHALLPLPVVMEARLLVDEARLSDAGKILSDFGMDA